MDRQRVYSGTPWEKQVGYCRAVRAGAHVFVAGTVAADEHGTVHGAGSVEEQARFILAKINRALAQVGARLEDVVRTRTFLVAVDRFDEFARAHGEVFRGIDPAATCVGVPQLVGPEYLIEIEVDAVIG